VERDERTPFSPSFSKNDTSPLFVSTLFSNGGRMRRSLSDPNLPSGACSRREGTLVAFDQEVTRDTTHDTSPCERGLTLT
jgi:hypothetical protein